MKRPLYGIITLPEGNWKSPGSITFATNAFYAAFPTEELAQKWLDAILTVGSNTLPLVIWERWEWDFATKRSGNYGEFVMSQTPEEPSRKLRFRVDHWSMCCDILKSEIPVIEYDPKDLTYLDAYHILKLVLPFWDEAESSTRLGFAYHYYSAIKNGATTDDDIFLADENVGKVAVPDDFKEIILKYHGDMRAGLEHGDYFIERFTAYDQRNAQSK